MLPPAGRRATSSARPGPRTAPPCDVGTAVLLDTRSVETPRPPSASSHFRRPASTRRASTERPSHSHRRIPRDHIRKFARPRLSSHVWACQVCWISSHVCPFTRSAFSCQIIPSNSPAVCALPRAPARSRRSTHTPSLPHAGALSGGSLGLRLRGPCRTAFSPARDGIEHPLRPPPPHCVVDFGSRASSRLFSQLRKSALAAWTIVLASRAQGGIPSREASASAAPPGCECAGGRRSGRRGGRC